MERILYVDCDAVVMDSLHPLWEIDLQGFQVGAVRNVFETHHLHRPQQLGLRGPETYFNSGVLLLNLREMRATGATETLLAEGRSRGADLEWPDQDTLNIVFEDRWLPLHPRWNVMNSMRHARSENLFDPGQVAEARRRPGIRHFEGPGDNKPWHYGCVRDDRDVYVFHRAQTPWPRYRLEGSPSSLRRVARAARRRITVGRT